jgi:hypothetical protein
MRELVYLSERKLRQFQAGRPPRPIDRIRVEGEIKVPGVGGVKVGPAGDGTAPPELDRVLAAIEHGDRPSRWFAENVGPGEWVQFETRMNYAVLGEAVVFVDARDANEQATGRLMLYGSREHLAGADSPPHVSASTVADFLGISARPAHAVLRQLVTWMLTSEEDHEARHGATRGVEELVRSLDLQFGELDGAAWLAGYARVTGVWPDRAERAILLGTPLYVEYVAGPSAR